MPNRLARWAIALIGLAVLLGATPVGAQIDPTSDEATELAERHAPVVMLKEQAEPCDPDGEPFAPMSVDAVLSNDDVLLRQAGEGDPIVRRAPSAADLHGRGEGFFLDFNGLALSPGCVYKRDFERYAHGSKPVVYSHVVKQKNKPDFIAVQYWLYWYFNDWNNTHESDWEFIQVLFEASSVTEALASDPAAVGYAQHEGGEKADWQSDKLERDGSHPVVYSSAGSHASYFTQSVFLGRQGTEGFGCDTTVGPSRRTLPDVVMLPDTADADSELGWLAFTGRWGERHSGPFNGPTGPNTKPQWDAPVDWFDELRLASVEIPAGADGSGTILDTFCGVVDSGSNLLRGAQHSPTETLLFLAAVAFVLRAFARRTDWSAVPPVPLRHRRRTGQMIRTAFASYWTSRGAMALVAMAYLPVAIIVGAVAATTTFTTGQAVAGALTSIMLALATATISGFWHLASSSGDKTFAGAVQLVRRRLPALILTLVRSVAIVTGLSLTVIGLPFAIRQAVRYQFAIPIVVTEEIGGSEALARSTDLVRGRWWRTTFTLVLFSALAAVVVVAVQLVVLVALAGAPLWLYSAVSFAGIGLVVPLVATPAILLYGDAVATEHDKAVATNDDRPTSSALV